MWITTNCGKLLEMGVPDHIICLLRNLYVGQEATVKTRHGTMDWFLIGKGVWQGCIMSSCLTSMHSTSCKCQAGWTTRWNQDCQEKYQQPQISRWYHSDGRKWEELRTLLMRMKEETEKAGLKLNIKKNKIMASSPITSWQIEGKKVEAETDFIFLSSKITAMTMPWN